jgi:hypothetical protein
MSRMLIIMHHIALCTIMFLAYVCLISSIGHVYVESKLEEPTERVQVEDFTKLDLIQGKPRCI